MSAREWWTPKKYIDAVYEVMGGIDLDPASCAEANETVRAVAYYTEAQNGLEHPWRGRVFLNPPGGILMGKFARKLYEALRADVTEAILLTHNGCVTNRWFQPCFDGVICFAKVRIEFDSPFEKRNSSTHGSVFVYFGPHEHEFARVFGRFGNVVRRARRCEVSENVADEGSMT